MTKAYVYVIECQTPNHYYVGETTHLETRLYRHRTGQGAAMTQVHGYKQVVQVIECEDKNEAKKIERLIVLRYKENPENTVFGAGWTAVRKETGLLNV